MGRHLTALLLASGICAASSSPEDTLRQTPTFRTRVNHVRVDVVVTDKDDRLVTDLTATDFEIREKGRPQQITDFEFVSVPLADRTIDLRSKPLPPPDVASNERPSPSSRAVVIMVGPFRPADLVPLKQVLTEVLSLLQPSDLVALTYTYRSDLGQDFTSDVGRLAQAADNATAAAGGFLAPRTLQIGFRNVIAALAAAPHARKAIFYVSNGTGIQIAPASTRAKLGSGFDELVEILEEARRVNIPIYAIDPHGLATPESVSNLGQIATPGNREGLALHIQREHDFLHLLAANTGGQAFVNQSNLSEATRRIVADNGGYYLLGYYPDPWMNDGEFHPIDVKVTRPGLRVRARAGYRTENTLPSVLARPKRLVDSLRDGVAGGDLQLRIAATPIAPSRRGAKTFLTLDVGYPSVDSERPRADDRLQLAWVALDPDARILASGEETLRVSLDRTGRGAFTLSVNQVIDVPRGKIVLRVAAASDLLDTRGAVHLQLDVPRLSGEPPAVTPLVLAVRADPAVRVAHIGQSATTLPLQPTTRRTFMVSERVAVFARVLGLSPGSAKGELRVRQGETIVRVTPVTLVPVNDEEDMLECQGVLALEGLAPGAYVLDVSVHGAANVSANRSTAITIK